MASTHRFTDYGFECYEEDTYGEKEEISTSFHFKLQKPISHESLKGGALKDDLKRRRWNKWRKWGNLAGCGSDLNSVYKFSEVDEEERDVHIARANAFRASMASSSVLSGNSKNCMNRSFSGPVIGSDPDFEGIRYLSLRDLTMEMQHKHRSSSFPKLKVYRVSSS